MTLLLILLAVGCLAYANGANDNFKGVATLFGSGATNYRGALAWATATTLAGSVTAIFMAEKLLKSFSGKGLVDDSPTHSLGYAAAVALGAGLTVLLATRLGLPISTTHGLIGALLGAGWAAGSEINFGKLGGSFFTPLLVSPLIALAAMLAIYPLLHALRRWLGISVQTCFCVGTETVAVTPLMDASAALEHTERLTLKMGAAVTCRREYHGQVLGITVGGILDRIHFLSAGIVSFARGLNDTPKIAALLLLAPALGNAGSLALVGVLIALGGICSARRVAETMSQKITPMNHGQGLTANLITGIIVIVASTIGRPVSTTHVSCGSLFGLGAATRQADPRMIGKILGAWLTTLPLGAVMGALAYWIAGRWS